MKFFEHSLKWPSFSFEYLSHLFIYIKKNRYEVWKYDILRKMYIEVSSLYIWLEDNDFIFEWNWKSKWIF